MARSAPPLTSAFVAEFARRLQGQSAALALPLTWIEQRLAESGQTIEQLRAAGRPAAGGRPGLDQQQHRQPAPARHDRLARVRRGAERGRADAARRPGRRLRRDGLRHARPLPPRGRGDRPRRRTPREVDVARQAVALCAAASAAERRAPQRPTAGAPRRLLPDRRGAAGARAGRRRATAARAARSRARRARGRCRSMPAPSAWPPLALAAAAGRSTRSGTLLWPLVGRDCARRGPAAGVEPAGAWRWSTGSPRCSSRRAPLPRMDFARHPAASRTLVVVPTMLGSAAGRRRAGRGARGALPRQPRPQPALRAADRLPRRRRASTCPRDDGAARAGAPRASRRSTRSTGRRRRARRHRLLPVPPPAPLERARARVDGPRAQARQAGRAERAAARQAARRALRRASSATPRALPAVRYVITLDTDTQLPRDAARAARRRRWRTR